eukprot:355677-Prymnesium_polylepis.1
MTYGDRMMKTGSLIFSSDIENMADKEFYDLTRHEAEMWAPDNMAIDYNTPMGEHRIPLVNATNVGSCVNDTGKQKDFIACDTNLTVSPVDAFKGMPVDGILDDSNSQWDRDCYHKRNDGAGPDIHKVDASVMAGKPGLQGTWILSNIQRVIGLLNTLQMPLFFNNAAQAPKRYEKPTDDACRMCPMDRLGFAVRDSYFFNPKAVMMGEAKTGRVQHYYKGRRLYAGLWWHMGDDISQHDQWPSWPFWKAYYGQKFSQFLPTKEEMDMAYHGFGYGFTKSDLESLPPVQKKKLEDH